MNINLLVHYRCLTVKRFCIPSEITNLIKTKANLWGHVKINMLESHQVTLNVIEYNTILSCLLPRDTTVKKKKKIVL